jgi:hypothetical protein
MALLSRVALADAAKRARGCSRPIRLVGSTIRVDRATGQVIERYGSADELDGITYVRCGDRRAHRCESCSREYKGDAWHLLTAGMSGGKGIPDTVAEHPCVFGTLTAPSFGPVHTRGRHGSCRPRRDRPVCPHGRPLYCFGRHDEDDRRLGEPLCGDCYDYLGHVLWQWWAPELWRRFTELLYTRLAHRIGLTKTEFREVGKLAYAKVVEFQARGIIHVHFVARLDGAAGPDSAPPSGLTATDIAAAVLEVAAAQRYTVRPDGDEPVALRWGDQADAGPADPEKAAGYLAKYLTKSTEDFGITAPGKVHSAVDARYLGARPHAVRLIETAEHLTATGGKDYARLADRYGTLGYRGHPITKTRRYSVTFGQLRRARRLHRRQPRLAPDADVREIPAGVDPDDNDTVAVIREWAYAGSGFLDADQAALAFTAAQLALERRRDRLRELTPGTPVP